MCLGVRAGCIVMRPPPGSHLMYSRVAVVMLVSLVALSPCALRAQGASDRDGVKSAALDYIEGFYEGDTAKLVRSIRPEVYKYGFDWVAADKRYVGEQMKWEEILGYARQFKARGRTTP